VLASGARERGLLVAKIRPIGPLRLNILVVAVPLVRSNCLNNARISSQRVRILSEKLVR